MQLMTTLTHGASEADIAWVVAQRLRHRNLHHILDTHGNAVSFCEYNARLRHGDSWARFPVLGKAEREAAESQIGAYLARVDWRSADGFGLRWLATALIAADALPLRQKVASTWQQSADHPTYGDRSSMQ